MSNVESPPAPGKPTAHPSDTSRPTKTAQTIFWFALIIPLCYCWIAFATPDFGGYPPPISPLLYIPFLAPLNLAAILPLLRPSLRARRLLRYTWGFVLLAATAADVLFLLDLL